MKHKKKKITLIAIFILFLGSYLGMKYLVPYFLAPTIKNLVQKELKAKIDIGDISFEPFGLVLKIKNLNLSKDSYLENLYVNLSIPDLKNRKINISKISIIGLNAEISDLDVDLIKKIIDDKRLSNPEISLKPNQKKWQFYISKIEIINSEILTLKNHLLMVENLEIDDLIIAKESSLKLKGKLKFNQSIIYLTGNVSIDGEYPKGQMTFKIDDFDLNFLNMLNDNITNIGDFQGKLSADGLLKFDGRNFNSKMDLALNDFFVYSRDLKTINYFAKELNVKDLKITQSEPSINFESSSILIKNLLLSKLDDHFDENKLSDFSKIEIDNLKISQDRKTFNSKGKINFTHGGIIDFKNFKSETAKELDLKIINLDLTQFSEALQSSLNYQISSGKLNLNAKTKTENGEIKGDVIANLFHLSLDDKNEFGEELQNNSSIPLKTALAFIKDKNGNIDFKFDIYGSENDPNFGLFNILGKGLGSIIVSKTSSLLATKLAAEFAPTILASIPVSPSNAIFLANKAYNAITKPRFKDVKFIPLTNQITEESMIRLEYFSQFLAEHRNLKFKICPIASLFESDQKNDQDKIDSKKALLIANKRIDALKVYFKEKMDNDLGQIIFCRPSVSSANKNISAAEISI
ncbi:MAG: hypothetical protein ACJA0S_000297 [Rickettsiales bacterium]|jgi:hypothetical protein